MVDNWTHISFKPKSHTMASMTVEDFERVLKISKPEDRLLSKTFQLNGKSMKICIYPCGQGEESKEYVSVFLINKSEEDIVVDVVFTTPMKEASFENTLIEIGQRYGYVQFIRYNHFGVIILVFIRENLRYAASINIISAGHLNKSSYGNF